MYLCDNVLFLTDITPAPTSTKKDLAGPKSAAGPPPGPDDSPNDSTGISYINIFNS